MALNREWHLLFLEPHWQADFLLTQNSTEKIKLCMTTIQHVKKLPFRQDVSPVLEGTHGAIAGRPSQNKKPYRRANLRVTYSSENSPVGP